MIQLSEDQRRELAHPEPIAFDPKTKEEYVLVRRKLYERMRSLLEGNTVVATGDLVDQVMAADDANDPNLASYQTICRVENT